jgi:hypothetical protein
MLTGHTADPPMDRCRVVRLHYRPCHRMHANLAGLGPADEAKPQDLGRLGIHSPAYVRQIHLGIGRSRC